MNGSDRFFEKVFESLEEVRRTQQAPMEQAAQAWARALQQGGMICTFGTGHSCLLMEEIFYRAGGLVRVYPLFEESLTLLHARRSSQMERLPGFARLILEDADPPEHSVLVVMSNSGRNSVVIEMAMAARERGMEVVCLTNLRQSQAAVSRHPSGKRLFEVADIVLDNRGTPGDAVVELFGKKSGATSTVIGASILQAVTCRTVELMGGGAEVFSSANIDGGDEANSRYLEKYKGVIKPL